MAQMNNDNFNDLINDLWSQTKSAFSAAKDSEFACELASLAYRPTRFKAIEALLDSYISAREERPDSTCLDRLATLCLYEEVTDPSRMKMRDNEFPIMSDEQQARRREGLHSRSSTVSGEVPLGAADSTGVDGKSYGIPTKRVRNKRENTFVDREAKSRNTERKRVYGEFTKVQPVITGKINK
jgi:phage gp36-like protein